MATAVAARDGLVKVLSRLGEGVSLDESALALADSVDARAISAVVAALASRDGEGYAVGSVRGWRSREDPEWAQLVFGLTTSADSAVEPPAEFAARITDEAMAKAPERAAQIAAQTSFEY